MTSFILRAEVSAFPLWTDDGDNVIPDSLPLSPRLLAALADWAGFFDDVGGEVSDREVLDEFVGQGFKIAHALRRELKGTRILFEHPVTGERVLIEHRAPR